MDEAVKTRIQSILDANPVVLFMKGSQHFPQCGFSHRAVEILKRCGATEIHSVNVLEDPEIRQGIKAFGNWPTIPPLHLKGPRVGGSAILMEMFESGELQPMVADAVAPKS